MTAVQFIEKCRTIHKDKFDYSKTKYIHHKSKVVIICNVCKYEFVIFPYSHLHTGGCRKCQVKKLPQNTLWTHEKFLQEAHKKHGDKFEYLSLYKGMERKIEIKCKECKHEFKTNAYNHARGGTGCPKCRYKKLPQNQPMDITLFEERCKKVHDNKYEYCGDFCGTNHKVSIFCKIHQKWFRQKAGSHLFDNDGCPYCCASKGEEKVEDLLKELNVRYEVEKSFEQCVNTEALFFDFYLPDYNACIEYDGKQHLYPIKWFGGKKNLEYVQRCDTIKNKFCADNGVSLLRIPFYEFNNIDKLISEFLQVHK